MFVFLGWSFHVNLSKDKPSLQNPRKVTQVFAQIQYFFIERFMFCAHFYESCWGDFSLDADVLRSAASDFGNKSCVIGAVDFLYVNKNYQNVFCWLRRLVEYKSGCVAFLFLLYTAFIVRVLLSRSGICSLCGTSVLMCSFVFAAFCIVSVSLCRFFLFFDLYLCAYLSVGSFFLYFFV